MKTNDNQAAGGASISSTATTTDAMTYAEDELLSPHFTVGEMTRSGTAVRMNIDNRPSKEVLANLKALCETVLEPLRQRYGRIIITSGYRSGALNKAVGGVPKSQHLIGEAADIYVASREKAHKYVAFIIEHTDFDQLLMEPRGGKVTRWLHVSYTRRRKNRHLFLK